MSEEKKKKEEDAQLIALAGFLHETYSDSIHSILLDDDPSKLHLPLVIEFAKLMDFDPEFAGKLYSCPGEYLPFLDKAAKRVKDAMLEELGDLKDAVRKKKPVRVRIDVSGSPLEFPEASPSIGKVRANHMRKLITLKGTVIRSGGVKMIEYERDYMCRKCQHSFTVRPELEAGNRINLPALCPSKSSRGCGSASFQSVEGSTICRDYQEIKIQENVQLLGVGSIPRSMPVILMDDLVDSIKPGDDVIITGILSAKWSHDIKDVRCNLDPMLLANYVRRTNELKSDIDIPVETEEEFKHFWEEYRLTPLKGRNFILEGICPQIFGLFTVKLAGTGKSQFLKFAAKLSNRSVITTGLGSTSAGLTVTAVKDGGEWMLEAGALVLADGGLCCIDEFDSMREHDRTTIHEAMEQQTISIAKAGLVTTLSTRTTVFGATNPKGKYDPDQSLSVNTTLSGPLLSRFDIVLVLLDTQNTAWDKIVSAHILKENFDEKKDKANASDAKWMLPKLRRYINYVKRFKPVLTKEAERVISSYYQLQRKSGTHNAARTTVRMLESLIRLAQAHARLMFSNEVKQLDAIAAILCIESSTTTSPIVDIVGDALHSNFTDNPDKEYKTQEKEILKKLGLIEDSP
ncbi:probable DNA helicase MCM9 isoform X4 [Panicum virgatum]|uniref:probable DNA helicase MCM9 isoform X4 n=1 Tax=Panicum virgatum TaxID=38727 RepID=UPI0019D5F206|nr:probable DNA helicase MCM9 isoform X4 [Panicum virgatum]